MNKAAFDKEVAELRREALEEWARVDTRHEDFVGHHEEFVTHTDVQFAELNAKMGSIKEMLAILVANSTTGKGTPMEETQAQSQAQPNEGNHSKGQAPAEQFAPQGTNEGKDEYEERIERAAQQLVGERRERRESEEEGEYCHRMMLRLAVNQVVREQRAMEKKPGRLLRPQNPSTPTDPMGPESVINDDEEPPGWGQLIQRVRYGTIVPDRRLTMETVEPWEARMWNIVRTMIQE